jgi:hypothetical protein
MRILWVAALLIGLSHPLTAQDLTAARASAAEPPDVAAPIKALLSTDAIDVKIGAAPVTFWWVKALPIQPGSADPPAWSQVTEGTVVGAVRLGAEIKDIRGRTIKPGFYTLRYGIQPANCDHLGVSPHRDFLLLSPAAADTNADPIPHEPLTELSAQATGISHPAIWSLDPPVASAGELLKVQTTEGGFKSVIFEVATSSGGTLRFGLIRVGEIVA